jgi:hypothetical protein
MRIEIITNCEPDQPINGWIIDGFPNTQSSLTLLEEAISGNDGNPNKQRGFNSVLFGKEAKSEEPYEQTLFPFRAFTSLVFIDVSNDVIFERASSQKMDPSTKQLYHMVYDPPNETDIELLNRLVPLDEIKLDKAQVSDFCNQYSLLNS